MRQTWRWAATAETLLAWIVGAGCLAYGLERAWPFTIDDAGIVYAYAEHLATGQGLRAVFGGPIVEGYSDFLWVMILAFGAKLGVAPPLAAKLLGAFLLAWTAVAGGALVAQNAPRSVAIRALPAVLMGTCPEFVVWAPSGLENSLYTAGLLTALYLDARESRDARLMPFSALAALAVSLTRPEGVVYAGVLGAFKLWCALKDRRSVRQAAIFFGLLLVPLALYHLWHWVTFRSLVPNTFYAKSPGLSGFDAGVTYVLDGLVTTRATFLIPLAIVGVWGGFRTNAPSLAFAAGSLAFAVYSRGDWMPHFRFVSVAFPMLAVLATIGLIVLSRLTTRLTARPFAPDVALGGALVVAGVAWAAHQHARFGDVRRLKWCHFCSRLDDVRNHQTERDLLGLGAATYLTHDFGGPAYSSTRDFMPLDLLGLADQSAALIEYRRTKGHFRAEFSRAQYFFHEQPDYPTFLYFTDNFWRALTRMPEFRFGYRDVTLSVPAGTKPLPPTRMHLGAFVDYFPEVPAFRFERLANGGRLIGAAAWRGAQRGDVTLGVSLQSVPEVTELSLRVAGTTGKSRQLFAGNRSVARGIAGVDPVSVALSITVPPEARPEDIVELGVRAGSGDARWTPLMALGQVRDGPPVGQRLPFPNNLPGASDPELFQLGRRLRALIDRRRAQRDHTLRDRELGDALLGAAAHARAEGRRADEYLGYVWTIQADPDRTPLLYQALFDLRVQADQNGFLLEHQLLQEFYATGEAYWQLQLIAAYAARKHWDKATYFLDRLPVFTDAAWLHEAAELRQRVDSRRAEAKPSPFAWVRVPGIASNFEEKSAEGWSHVPGGFRLQSNDEQSTKPVWGIAGTVYLSSEGTDGPATAESAPFTIDGTALGFVIAGGDHRALRAELVVDNEAVATAKPPRSRSFAPVLWDTAALRGRTARLRLVDEAEGTLQFLAVDDFRVWPFVKAPGKAQ